MKNFILIFINFYFISEYLIAQNLIIQKTIPNDKDEIFFETIELKNKEYLSLGWSYLQNGNETDFYLVNSDSLGNTNWEKRFGGYDKETGISLKEFKNGNLLICGTTRSFGNGAGDCWFIITDNKGNAINEFTYGGIGDDYLRDAIITEDQEIVFVGFTKSPNGLKDILLGEINQEGNLIWIRTFGGNQDDEGWSIKLASDKGYILSGFSAVINSSYTSKVIKTDKNGIRKWEFSKEQVYTPYNVTCTIENSKKEFIVVSTIKDTGTERNEISITKLDNNGAQIALKTVKKGFNAEVRWITETPNGYAIACSIEGKNKKTDIYIIFLDADLNEIKYFTFDYGDEDNAWKVNSIRNKVILSGSVTSEIDGSLDPFFSAFEIIPPNSSSDSIQCIKIPIYNDVAIGYHDFYNTSSSNFGDAIQLATYTIPGALGGLNQNRALFKFDIPEELDTVKILSANLNLFATGPLGTLNGHTGIKNQGILQKITKSWEENTATWDNQPPTVPDNQVVLNNPLSAAQDYSNVDITKLFLDLKSQNYGLMLKQKDEIPTNALLFCSSDYPNSEKHPYLEVCYLKKSPTIISDTTSCDFVFYPNPTSQKLFLKLKNIISSKKCYIYTISGQLINSYSLTYPITEIDVEQFPSGIYIAYISDESCVKTFKFEVIKK